MSALTALKTELVGGIPIALRAEARPEDLSAVRRITESSGFFQTAEIEVAVEISSSLPLVSADRIRITQVLTNLLDNAFNYTPEGGTILVTADESEGFVRVSVSDNGIGIKETVIPKIFDRFFRAEDVSVQHVSGTGLGLSIVSSLIEMHGGKIEVESVYNEGSTFMFSLPAIVEDIELA